MGKNSLLEVLLAICCAACVSGLIMWAYPKAPYTGSTISVLENTEEKIPVLVGFACHNMLFSMHMQKGEYTAPIKKKFAYSGRLSGAWLYLDQGDYGDLTTKPISVNSPLWKELVPQKEEFLDSYNVYIRLGYSKQVATERVLTGIFTKWLVKEVTDKIRREGATDDDQH